MKCFVKATNAVVNHVETRSELLIDPLGNVYNDNKTKGPPPPPPTPLELPRGPSNEALSPLSLNAQEIFQLFLKIHRAGPTVEHLRSLGIRSSQEVSLDDLIPKGFLPDASWLQDPATTGGSSVFPAPITSVKILSNGVPIPDHETYYKLAKELLYDNEDAFSAIQKKPSGQPPVRLATFRKYWDHLFQMALYWDTSLDNYDDTGSDQDAMDVDQQLSANIDQKSKAKSKTTYTGRRIATGRDMPPRFRDDAVFAFVEAITLVFRCRTERSRTETRVKFHTMSIPLPHTATVYRSPKDRVLARGGFLEGPLTAIQCSNQTSFRRAGEAEGQGQGELANLLREVGLILNLAQKRAREGQKEPDTSEGKWWVTKPRWGGGPGGEFGGLDDEDTEGSSKGRKRSKKSSAAYSWKRLQPQTSDWDKCVIYKQIGKDALSNLDTVSSHFEPYRDTLFNLITLTDLPHLLSKPPYLDPCL